MRPDRFSLAKAWINDERSTPEEAKATWDAMGKEFDENRKAMLMASAESDKIKNMMNKKYGPGTMKYGSEISQPSQRPDVIEIDAINSFMKRNPAAEGGRMRFDKGGFTDSDILEIKSKLPEGINIEYDSGSGRWRYMTSITQADGSKKRMRLPMLKAFDLEADENLKKILEAKGKAKEVFDLSLKIGGKTVLTPEKFYELRLKDSKLSLNEFLEKLTKKGFVKPDGKPFGSKSALHRLQQELGIADLVGGDSNAARRRSLQDIKAIVRSAPNGPQILKSITDESELRKIANALVSRDRLYERRGSFPVGRSKENKMWHNLWRASNTGNRIEIIGEFANGKLPVDSNGRVNWQMPNKDGVPAWKRVQFIDNQKNKAPLKWIDMPGARSLGNQGQLRSQVDEIYGKGFFDRKMKPYDLQKQIGDLEIDIDGQKAKVGTILNENIVKNRLMDKLIKENNGAVPTEAEFNKRYNSYRNKLKLFNSMNVQHTKGVGLDPYTTELTTQSANAKERAIVQKYNTAIKKTTDSTELLKLSNNFANDINNLEGSIRSFDVQTGTVKGTKATPSSLATQLVDEARLDDETSKKIIQVIKSVGCPTKDQFAEGGRTGFSTGGDCFDKGQKLINNGMKDASQASKINAAKFLNSAYKTGRNVMKFGIIPEAIFVSGESLLRSLGDQTLDEGFKSAIGFYTDFTGLTDFKADARISQNLRNMGVDATMNIEKLVNFNNAKDDLNKLKENQKKVLSAYDENLMGGVSEQDYKKQSDANIVKAQEYLDKNFLKESEKLYYSQQQDTAADIAGTRSPFQKAYAAAKNKTENLRSDGSIIDLNDLSGMQSDMFMIDPMSAQAKKARVQDLPPQSPLTGSKGEQDFLNLSQLPMGPRMGSEIDVLAKAMNENFAAQGLDQRTDAAYLKAMQDYKQNYKDMTMEEMLAIGIPREAIYGFNQPEVIKEKPVYDFSEGGITGLRSKYDYKK
jgi:hypothetical protein